MAKQDNNIIARRIIHSYLSSVISISLVLLLVAVALFFAFNARIVSSYVKENAVVTVILSQGATEQEALDLQQDVSAMPFVRRVQYISKEEGQKQMEELLGENFLDVFSINPIPVSLDVTVRGEYFSRDSLLHIKADLSALPLVREVTYQESLVESLNSNLEKIAFVLAVVILLLLFISFVLIGNTVRLNVYAKRFTIHTMRLVGAKRSFIRRPFMLQALLQGLASALIADGVFALMLHYAKASFGELFDVFDINLTLTVYGIVAAAGVLLCTLVCYFVVNKLAYMSKDELYY